jgi:hypothetical protein
MMIILIIFYKILINIIEMIFINNLNLKSNKQIFYIKIYE